MMGSDRRHLLGMLGICPFWSNLAERQKMFGTEVVYYELLGTLRDLLYREQ